jgi:hypothetical protein
MPNDTRGRLDHAIDRAVRGMMHVDPAPGLRVRVVDRLEKRPARRALPLAFASAAALIVIVIVSVALFREVRPEKTIETGPMPAPVSQTTSVASPAVSPSPQSQSRMPSSVPVPDAAAPVRRPRALPRPSVVFDGPRDRVSAANVRPATTEVVEAPQMPETFVPIGPIVIAPISIAPIVIPPLIVAPLSDRK